MESKDNIEDCKSEIYDAIGLDSKEIENELSNVRISNLVGEAKDKKKTAECSNYRPRSSTIKSSSEEKDELCHLPNKSKKNSAGPEIVDKVIELMLGSEMAGEFEEFARSNIGPFKEYAEKYDNVFDIDEIEYTVEQMEVYNLYLDTFEKKVESFIKNCGYNIDDFFTACANILDDPEEDFAFNPRKFFINSILSTIEFKVFFNMMYSETKRLTFEASFYENSEERKER